MRATFSAKNLTTNNLITLVEFLINVYSDFADFYQGYGQFSMDKKFPNAFVLILDLLLQKIQYLYKNLLREGQNIVFDEPQETEDKFFAMKSHLENLSSSHSNFIEDNNLGNLVVNYTSLDAID